MSFFKDKIVWPLRYKWAVRSADKRSKYIGANIYVLKCGPKLLLMSKRDIDIAVARGVFNCKGATIRKKAIYTARVH